MALEAFLVQLKNADVEHKNIVINDNNAYSVGVNIDELRIRFYQETGRVILTNENIKVRFDKEGNKINFSTFDGVSVRVPFDAQALAPNKGGDGFGLD